MFNSRKTKYAMPFIGLIYFGIKTKDANIFADDAGFLGSFKTNGFSTMFTEIRGYVPGRNLHILFQDLYFAISGTDEGTFYRYHFIQALLYVGVFGLAFLIMKKAGVGDFFSLVFVILGATSPLNSTVLLWSSALPMHITSTFFLLVALYLLTPGRIRLPSNSFRSWLLVLLLGISMFTYDQSAAVVLALTILSFYLTFRKSPVRWVHYLGEIKVTFGLGLLSVFYLVVVFLGRGIDGNLTFGPQTTARLIGNIFLPFKAYSKIRNDGSLAFGLTSQFSYLVLFSFILISSFLILWILLNSKQLLRNIEYTSELQVSTFFFVLSVISFLPAALWSIVPRHLFAPSILLSISFSLWTLGAIHLSGSWSFSIRVVAVFLIPICVTTQSNVISDWLQRDVTRRSFYLSLEDSYSNLGISCFTQGPKLNELSSMVYSERMNIAIGYYSRNGSTSSYLCSSEPLQGKDSVWDCKHSIGVNWYEVDSYDISSNGNVKKIYSHKIC